MCRLWLNTISLQTHLPSELQLRWEQHNPLPFAMAFPYSVVAQGKVYVGGGSTDRNENELEHIVMVCNKQGVGRKKLPKYRYQCFAMAVLQDQLTLVGGIKVSTKKVTNKITVWDSRQWTYPYLPMPTPRHSPAVVTYTKWLVVAGGHDGSHSLNTVEIMDTTNIQWFTAAPLPVGCRNMTSALVGEKCYFMGGFTNQSQPNKQVFHLSIPTITSQAAVQWHTLPDTPLACSAALALHGSLLAVGGRHRPRDSSSAIHLYQPESGQWVKVDDLPTARDSCSCTQLPSGEILVIGGYNISFISRVDVASVDWLLWRYFVLRLLGMRPDNSYFM